MAENEKKAESKPKGKKAPRPSRKKKIARSVSLAKAHIQCTFNNTIISITDDHGGVIAWSTAGSCGFSGTKKGTPFAAQVTADRVAQKAKEYGVKQIGVFVKGAGSGRETAIRALQANGFSVTFIKDASPMPHNGCRPPKPRRV